MTYQDAKREVAIKHKLGTALVTGHKSSYFDEAVAIYSEQFKVKNHISNTLSLDSLSQEKIEELALILADCDFDTSVGRKMIIPLTVCRQIVVKLTENLG